MSIRSSLRDRLGHNKVERGTLVVSRNSFHGRLYHFWRENSQFKNTRGYRENLCHYVRVVLFWAPIAVFLHAHPKDKEYLRPAVVFAALSAVGGVVAAFTLNPGGSLLVTLYILGIAAALVGTIFVAYQVEEHKSDIRYWWRNEGRGVSALKLTGRVVSAPFRAALWVAERTLVPVAQRFARLCEREVFGDIPLGFIFLLAAVVIGVTLGSIFGDIVVLVFALCLLAGTALFVALLFAVEVLKDYLDSRDRDRHRSVGPPKVRDEGLFKVGARFASAKKGKICPFIEVV